MILTVVATKSERKTTSMVVGKKKKNFFFQSARIQGHYRWSNGTETGNLRKHRGTNHKDLILVAFNSFCSLARLL